METGALVRSFKLVGESPWLHDRCDSSGKWLCGRAAIDGSREMFVVWDALSGSVAARFPDFRWPYDVAALSPDGRLLAVGATNHLIKVWSLTDKRWIYTLPGHTWHALALNFSPDSRYLATGSWDGEARV